MCQRSWLYLEPIFSSDDIMKQLPVEGKRYQTMDRIWRKTMSNAHQDPKVTCFVVTKNENHTRQTSNPCIDTDFELVSSPQYQ